MWNVWTWRRRRPELWLPVQLCWDLCRRRFLLFVVICTVENPSQPWESGGVRERNQLLLRVLLDPGRDFFLELRLQDAGDVVGILDLVNWPVLSHRLQRLDIQLLDQIILVADQEHHRHLDGFDFILGQRKSSQTPSAYGQRIGIGIVLADLAETPFARSSFLQPTHS